MTLTIASPAFLLRAADDPKDAVLQADAAYTKAKINGDLGALDRIVASDYMGVNQWGGFIGTKQQLLDLYRRGYRDPASFPCVISVRLFGDTAVVNGRVSSKNLGTYMYMRTFVKRDERWQLLTMTQVLRVNWNTMQAGSFPTCQF